MAPGHMRVCEGDGDHLAYEVGDDRPLGRLPSDGTLSCPILKHVHRSYTFYSGGQGMETVARSEAKRLQFAARNQFCRLLEGIGELFFIDFRISA